MALDPREMQALEQMIRSLTQAGGQLAQVLKSTNENIKASGNADAASIKGAARSRSTESKLLDAMNEQLKKSLKGFSEFAGATGNLTKKQLEEAVAREAMNKRISKSTDTFNGLDAVIKEFAQSTAGTANRMGKLNAAYELARTELTGHIDSIKDWDAVNATLPTIISNSVKNINANLDLKLKSFDDILKFELYTTAQQTFLKSFEANNRKMGDQQLTLLASVHALGNDLGNDYLKTFPAKQAKALGAYLSALESGNISTEDLNKLAKTAKGKWNSLAGATAVYASNAVENMHAQVSSSILGMQSANAAIRATDGSSDALTRLARNVSPMILAMEQSAAATRAQALAATAAATAAAVAEAATRDGRRRALVDQAANRIGGSTGRVIRAGNEHGFGDGAGAAMSTVMRAELVSKVVDVVVDVAKAWKTDIIETTRNELRTGVEAQRIAALTMFATPVALQKAQQEQKQTIMALDGGYKEHIDILKGSNSAYLKMAGYDGDAALKLEGTVLSIQKVGGAQRMTADETGKALAGFAKDLRIASKYTNMSQESIVALSESTLSTSGAQQSLSNIGSKERASIAKSIAGRVTEAAQLGLTGQALKDFVAAGLNGTKSVQGLAIEQARYAQLIDTFGSSMSKKDSSRMKELSKVERTPEQAAEFEKLKLGLAQSIMGPAGVIGKLVTQKSTVTEKGAIATKQVDDLTSSGVEHSDPRMIAALKDQSDAMNKQNELDNKIALQKNLIVRVQEGMSSKEKETFQRYLEEAQTIKANAASKKNVDDRRADEKKVTNDVVDINAVQKAAAVGAGLAQATSSGGVGEMVRGVGEIAATALTTAALTALLPRIVPLVTGASGVGVVASLTPLVTSGLGAISTAAGAAASATASVGPLIASSVGAISTAATTAAGAIGPLITTGVGAISTAATTATAAVGPLISSGIGAISTAATTATAAVGPLISSGIGAISTAATTASATLTPLIATGADAIAAASATAAGAIGAVAAPIAGLAIGAALLDTAYEDVQAKKQGEITEQTGWNNWGVVANNLSSGLLGVDGTTATHNAQVEHSRQTPVSVPPVEPVDKAAVTTGTLNPIQISNDLLATKLDQIIGILEQTQKITVGSVTTLSKFVDLYGDVEKERIDYMRMSDFMNKFDDGRRRRY